MRDCVESCKVAEVLLYLDFAFYKAEIRTGRKYVHGNENLITGSCTKFAGEWSAVRDGKSCRLGN